MRPLIYPGFCHRPDKIRTTDGHPSRPDVAARLVIRHRALWSPEVPQPFPGGGAAAIREVSFSMIEIHKDLSKIGTTYLAIFKNIFEQYTV